MKIAIIGSGISGLTAAYLLCKNHDIAVFEANDYIGGHTHTHDLEIERKNWRIDSGFIVYNEKTYPNFIKLLNRLNVATQKTSMGFSVKAPVKNLEYSGGSLNALFAQRRNLFRPYFYLMIKDILRFNRVSISKLKGLSETTTINEFLINNNFGKQFIENYIIPMGAAIWSTATEKTMEMPAVFYIRFFQNHGLLQINKRPQWHVIKDGSKSYIKKIIEPFKSRILLSTPVKKVKRHEHGVEIVYGGDERSDTFDKVIFANHSNQALELLDEPSAEERLILGALPYQKNVALLHTDSAILPKKKITWSSWNYLLSNDISKPVTLTYNMNILQSLDSKTDFLVTLNSNNNINPQKVIKTITYHHPLFTVAGIKAQKQKHLINGNNNTFYCGAYWGYGFHEDGVNSALDVCSFFGKSL
jgi:predicted NAD/FAD-binding protein